LHQRYLQQATWTSSLRQYLYQRVGLSKVRRVLDVGCGTGALMNELTAQANLVFGLDIDCPSLRTIDEKRNLTCSDGYDLPFPEQTFDICLCHFLLLWVDDPVRMVREMSRVTRTGGTVLALAEPDYGGRIDYPEELTILGEWQQQSLHQQGADPKIGRKLAGIFQDSGLCQVETGILGGEWHAKSDRSGNILEWQIIRQDLEYMNVREKQLNSLMKIDHEAWQSGKRVLFVPTFWAMAKR